MSTLSTTRKLGIAARVATQQLRRIRTFGAVMKAGQVTAGRWGRILSQLWLEVTGFVFLALAAIGALALGREWAKFHAGGNPGRLAVAAVFTLLFGWFGASSFWSARKRH